MLFAFIVCNHIINLNLFFSESSVFADSYSHFNEINSTNITNDTDGVDVSA